MKILGIIPARYASTRFPGKPLVNILGKTMIQRVYEQAKKAKSLTEVIVATDDERIFKTVQTFGGNVIMTATTHKNGTERCAEVAANQSTDFDIIINIQGDEPFIHPEQINLLANFMIRTNFQIGTLVKKIATETELLTPNTAKVVFSEQQSALFFSRQPIPFIRNHAQNWLEHHTFYKHIGMYAFRTNILQKVAMLPSTPLEKAESLEQLRWLQHGIEIGVEETERETFGIDTPGDLEHFLEIKNKE